MGTPAGSLAPAEPSTSSSSSSSSFRSCGRVFGLALCQAENAAQEQSLREGATLADMLATVVDNGEDDDNQPQQHQKLLVGAPLSRYFLRALQYDPPSSAEELQAELNAEQSESAPDFRGSAAFIKSTLSELGLEG